MQKDQMSEISQGNQFKQIQNYVIGSGWKLGAGSFSEVYKAVDQRDNKKVAAKIIKLQKITTRVAATLLKQELQIIKIVDHPNIIAYFDVFNTSNNCYIFCEYCQYGDLDSLLKMKKSFDEEEVTQYIYDIYEGLKYLSGKNILHRDLKPANIFVTQNNKCKIADFGFSIQNPDGGVFKDIALGSPAYMAPEIIHLNEYGPKTDVWAFGCIIYELLAGFSPFSDIRTPEQLKQRVLCPPCALKKPISLELTSLINACLCVNPNSRLGFDEMPSHPYFQKIRKKNELTESRVLSQTKFSTNSSNCFLRKIIKNGILNYDEAIAVLQYCKLSLSILKKTQSEIIRNWHLSIVRDLESSQLGSNMYIDMNKFKENMLEKLREWKKMFGKVERLVSIEEVLEQCKKIGKNNKKMKEMAMWLFNQTCLLQESMAHPLRLIYYAKNSRILEYHFNKN